MNRWGGSRCALSLLVASCLAWPEPSAGQDACPAGSAQEAEAGWEAYRAGDMEAARARFEEALGLCGDDLYARTGLGYVLLRGGAVEEAAELWTEVVEAEPENVDALTGLGLAAWRTGEVERAEDLFERVVAVDEGHPTALEYLERIRGPTLGPAPDRPPLSLPDSLELRARTAGERFEVLTPEGWRPFYIKGVNLGAALPGRYPSQFPDSITYARWIEGMAEMNANVVRLYTIHPPAFYQALSDWNETNPERALWLIHGAWTGLPPDHDFSGEPFESEFFEEMRRVVDVLHGRASIEYRPGHAWGHYTADVAPWTLAYILGREWEPFSALAYDSIQGGRSGFEGRYVRVEGGNAMDAWMGKAVEEIVAYETDTYRAQRPVAYTNWPTLDPLSHPSETTVEEEMAIRRAFGEDPGMRPREYENDAISLDATRIRPTNRFRAGYFASFHAYPYYPDFMILSERYAESRSTMGPSRYAGYLRDLKEHHRGMPLVISEYGVPASLGNAHLQPQGWHHGGLTEAEMAEVDRRLTLELAETGMAGGVLFAWIDEWFKQNWVALEFELPQDRNRLWYNRLDAEQHYGLWAIDAAPPFEGQRLPDRREAWEDVDPLYRTPELTVRASHDAAYLWLLVETPDRAPSDTTLVGFDVFDAEAGDFRWPGRVGERLPVGLEFVLRATGDEVRVMADPPSNPFRLAEVGQGATGLTGRRVSFENPPEGLFHARVDQRFNLPYYTEPNDDGRYDSLRVVVNRRRFTRDSTEYLAAGYDRGILPSGAAPDGFWERSADGSTLEVRIPWLLLNVTDPSSRTVLQGPGDANARDAYLGPDGRWSLRDGVTAWPDSVFGALGTEQVDDIGIVAAVRGNGRTLRVPDREGETARFSWPTWESPEWVERSRPAYETMKEVFAELRPYTPGPAVPPPAAAAPDTLDEAAAEAWVAGDTETAMRLYEALLEENPEHGVALHRTALMHAWEERYEEALTRFDRLLEIAPENLAARVDRARVLAWSGETDDALAALDIVLEEEPGHPGALEARALFEAWAGRYEASLETYDRLLAISPDNTEARRQQATVLGWASKFTASVAVYDSLLAADPADLDARLGRARALAFSDRLEEAVDEYDRVLEREPDHGGALVGRGRTLGWAGALVEGEETLRRAVEEADGAGAWVALGQNLRWQGRNAAALQALERAVEVDPTHGEAREQLRSLRAAFEPDASPNLSFESDSDGNRMRTAAVATTWHASPRWRLRADLYEKGLRQNELERSSMGLTVSASYTLEPGWTLSAGAGGSRTDAPGADSRMSGRLSVSTPGRYPLGLTFRIRTAALDATAALASAGVRMSEGALTGRWRPSSTWRLNGSAGYAVFDGSERNRRVNGALSVSRTLGGGFAVGVASRAFTYDKDLQDGYFDPDFYGIGELTGRWLGRAGDWGLLLEVAPGMQQVTHSGDPAGTVRASTRVSYDIAPGRNVALSGGYSSTGLQSFSTGDSDYRYTALILSAGWRF
ncbi:MAG: tetratricopeptide repeat protein [Gemmatimonadota bacterium]|nr:tetratricopeptide repeat protein [Gemmatimonadota bacterium]